MPFVLFSGYLQFLLSFLIDQSDGETVGFLAVSFDFVTVIDGTGKRLPNPNLRLSHLQFSHQNLDPKSCTGLAISLFCSPIRR